MDYLYIIYCRQFRVFKQHSKVPLIQLIGRLIRKCKQFVTNFIDHDYGDAIDVGVDDVDGEG